MDKVIEKLADKMMLALENFIDFMWDGQVSQSSQEKMKALEVTREEFIGNPLKVANVVAGAAWTAHLVGRHNRAKKEKLASAINNVAHQVENYARFLTTHDILRASDVETVRTKPGWLEYGGREEGEAKRATTCRSCAKGIAKGEKVFKFYWDFAGSGSWTAVTCMIHHAPCATVNES
jgi:hypothetical protein